MPSSECLSGADPFFKPNQRLAETPASLIRAIGKVEHEGNFPRIALNLGELNFPMPQKAQEANARAIQEGKTMYTDNAGLPQLRDAVAADFSKWHDVRLDRGNVIITSGSTGALYIAFEAFLSPGDEVLIPSLSYSLYDIHPKKWGAKPVRYNLTDTFDIDTDDLIKKINPNTKLIVVNSPSNPTGQIVSVDAMKKVAQIVDAHPQAFVVSDEIYSSCVFDGAERYSHSMAEFSDRVVIVDGLSKRASQTGKRLGWLIVPHAVIEQAEKSQQQTYVCAPTDSQYAALPVMGGECDDDLRYYRDQLLIRKESMGDSLAEIPGIKFLKPKGAFYYFVDISKYGTSMEVATKLIKRVNVVTTPGLAFGDDGDKYIRLSFAGDPMQAKEAIRRMKGVFEKW